MDAGKTTADANADIKSKQLKVKAIAVSGEERQPLRVVSQQVQQYRKLVIA